tara:strand:- start:8241 stop:9032 length:792 start_codon:yes stop_codon:yes gene_type:complete
MIFIDRGKYKPDKVWIKKADGLTRQLMNATSQAARNKIIDDNEKVWGELKDFLLSISNEKCWYSEAKDSYNHLHVDHFRPKKIALDLDKKDKGGYWWLAFNWLNYRVCGGVGNVKKRDKFAVRSNKAIFPNIEIDDEIIYFLDPCEEEDVLKITFNENGEMQPISPSGWDYESASYTIENLNLNFKKLREARKEIWIKCFSLITETQILMDKNQTTPSPKRKGQIKEKVKQLKELVNPSSAYSATAKACLTSAGLMWTMKIAA